MAEPLRLLLVEDSPADVFLVKEALREEGLAFELRLVEDGEAAIEILDQLDSDPLKNSHVPNLLLLDLNVPRKSGIQVLERFHQISRCANIPVIVISSSDSPAERQRVIELGACEYFRKPSSLTEFMTLGKVIRAWHERRPVS